MRLFDAEHPPIPWLGVCAQQVNGRWEANARWGYRRIVEEGRHKRLTQALALLNVAVWGITGRTLWQWEGILYQVEQWFKKMVEAQAKEHPKVALTFGSLAVIWFMLLAIGHLLVGNWWWSAVDVIVVAFYGSLARLAYRCLRYPPLEVATTDDVFQRIINSARQVREELGVVETLAQHSSGLRQAAIGRAWATLYSYLSETEKQQLAEHGYFEVPSKLTVGRVYRIPAVDGTASMLDNGRQVMSICTRPEDAGIPWPDVMLAYKLGLQADEERWLETANKWPALYVAQPHTEQAEIVEGGAIDWNTVRPDITAEAMPNRVSVTVDDSRQFATVTIPRGTSFSANFNWAGDSLNVSDVVIAREHMPLVVNEAC